VPHQLVIPTAFHRYQGLLVILGAPQERGGQ
jgi:hypothetical protein